MKSIGKCSVCGRQAALSLVGARAGRLWVDLGASDEWAYESVCSACAARMRGFPDVEIREVS